MPSEEQSPTQQVLSASRADTTVPKKIVVIGGGTGGSTVVKALMGAPFFGEGVTAIATTFDDGGGTGELRKVYPELPAVGDLRQCLDAMSQLSAGARRALASRFAGGDSSDMLILEGQTLGNLIIARAIQAELVAGGTFSSALDIIGEILQIKGHVAPPSDDIRTLVFELLDGTRIYGEHEAEQTLAPTFEGAKISFLDGRRDKQGDIHGSVKPARISEEAEVAIREAELVIIAPGDLYTSIGPNLAVQGMGEALQTAGAVIMISNLMNRDRHTIGFTTHKFAQEMTRIINARVIRDVLYSTTQPDQEALEQQVGAGSHPVQPDVDGLKRDGYSPRGFDLVSHQVVVHDPHDPLIHLRSDIRHDPAKVAAAILEVYASGVTGA